MDVTVLAGKDGKGFDVVDTDGNETHYEDRERLSLALKSAIDADPAAAVAANMAFRREAREDLRLDIASKQLASQLKTQAAQTALAFRASGRADRADAREQTKFDQGQQDLETFRTAIDSASNPDLAYLDPEGYGASVADVTRLVPTLAKGYAKEGENSYPVNLFVDQGQRRVQRIQSSPYVQQGVIARSTSGGKPVFAVADPVTHKGVGYASFDEAEAAARKLYGAPKGKKK
jgi:hypothetical protein